METAATYSYINMILLSIIGGAFFMLCTVMGYWASSVNKRLDDLSDEQSANGIKSTTLDQWTLNHDKQDDERHQESVRKAEGIQRDIRGLFDELRKKP